MKERNKESSAVAEETDLSVIKVCYFLSASYMDEQIIEGCNSYNRTGIIDEVLLIGFNQFGSWTGLWMETTGEEFDPRLVGKLELEKIPAESLVKTDSNDEKTLLCTFVDLSEETVNIDYVHIAGHIVVPNARKFIAPLLKSVDGAIDISGVEEVCAPSLQCVRKTFDASNAIVLNIPALEYVGGDF